MSDKPWLNVLMYAPEAAIFPAAALAAAVSWAVQVVRKRIGAWLWRRNAWPRRVP